MRAAPPGPSFIHQRISLYSLAGGPAPLGKADLSIDTRPIERLRSNITSVYMGNTAAVDRVIVCLLARGHLLIEDVPGVGKTVLANALARSIRCRLSASKSLAVPMCSS